MQYLIQSASIRALLYRSVNARDLPVGLGPEGESVVFPGYPDFQGISAPGGEAAGKGYIVGRRKWQGPPSRIVDGYERHGEVVCIGTGSVEPFFPQSTCFGKDIDSFSDCSFQLQLDVTLELQIVRS